MAKNRRTSSSEKAARAPKVVKGRTGLFRVVHTSDAEQEDASPVEEPVGTRDAMMKRFRPSRVTDAASKQRSAERAARQALGRAAAAETELARLRRELAALRMNTRVESEKATAAVDTAHAKLEAALSGGMWHREISDPEDVLVALSAQRNLATVQSRRAMHALLARGVPQMQVAKVAGVSQAHVSRTAALLADHPELLEETPEEIVWRHAVGEIHEGEMLRALVDWPFTRGRVRDDAYEAGTFDQLTTLVAQGFLTEEQFRTIRERATVRG